MKVLRNYKLWLTIVLGIAFFIAIFPYYHDMYIGGFHTAICIIINALSTILFSFIFYKIISKKFQKEDFGTYLCYLVLLGIVHGMFTIMNWGSWLCLGISVVIIVWMIIVWRR